MVKKQEKNTPLVVDELKQHSLFMWLKGDMPLVYNAVSEKVKRELLFPRGRKTKADKEQNMKHDPVQEFRDSVYQNEGTSCATRLMVPSTMFKAAIMNAALEIPGAKKAQIGRIVWVVGDTVDTVNVYGVPRLWTSVVRSADINKTPDIRTRAVLTEWCCRICVRYMVPTLTETAVGRLVQMAGLLMGIGDFRQQKGKGSYGQFSLVNEADCKAIIKRGGRVAQDKALRSPDYYDAETRKLMTWFDKERKRRGR